MKQGERLLREEGLLRLPVDLEALASTRGISIRAIDSSEAGVSGMLLRHGDTFGILYATNIPNRGYQRFSIAHELGHYFIDGHLDHIPFDENRHVSRAGFVSNDAYEREADYFAAGLLMPSSLISGVIDRTTDGMRAIEAIRHEACASLTAAAIRYVGLTDAVAAIVMSRDGQVDYCFMSDAMRSRKGTTWPRKGSPIPAGTATDALHRNSEDQRVGAHDEADVDIMEWFGGQVSLAAREEVVQLGSYGRVLTVLTCPELLDEGFMEEDEESDEALEDRWTPCFRR